MSNYSLILIWITYLAQTIEPPGKINVCFVLFENRYKINIALNSNLDELSFWKKWVLSVVHVAQNPDNNISTTVLDDLAVIYQTSKKTTL